MASDGTNCYTYNDANQLSQVKNCNTNQVIAQYVYDYQGNRIEKKVYNNGTLQQTIYSPSKEYQTVKMASNGATLNTSYYYVNEELAAQKNPNGTKNYVLSDNLGSTNAVTDQNGNVVENTTYYPYGQIRSGGTQSKYLYTGQQNDTETNLDYYNARYYDPSIQHFTQPDSELPNVYDPQQLNRYAYARNNPMTLNDPTGHFLPLLIAAAAAVVEAADAIMYSSVAVAIATHPDEAEAAIFGGISIIQAGHDALQGDFNNASSDLVNGAISYMVTRVKAPPDVSSPQITSKYTRPNGATTNEQRSYVQGQPCVTCGVAADKMVPDHNPPLVQEYYNTGTIDIQRMRSLDAIQPQCISCSRVQGGQLSNYSKQKALELNLNVIDDLEE